MPSAVGNTSFSMKNEMLHLTAGFNNFQHILTNQSGLSRKHGMEWGLNRSKAPGSASLQIIWNYVFPKND
jgi:hypothetical protein